MRITSIEAIHADRYLFVLVSTDEGITGVGEAGAFGYFGAVEGALAALTPTLIGEDPLRREHHLDRVFRSLFFRGAAISSAMSALDIAFWDIAGKYHDAPVHQLMGGRTRDRIRAYARVSGATPDELLASCADAVAHGFTAVGHLNPFLDAPRYEPLAPGEGQRLAAAVDVVRRCREELPPGTDLCLEVHRRLSPGMAIQLARLLEPFCPLFIEDPTAPENLDATAQVARSSPIPIATGERLDSIHAFEMLLRRDAVHHLRPDLCLIGGLTAGRKVAALGEANHAEIVPHNPLGPVNTAACVQLAASIPNFAIQEYDRREAANAKDVLVREPVAYADGYLEIPDRPGIGVELAEHVRDVPPVHRALRARQRDDGSVTPH